jgi:hypothetical protein
MKIEFGQTKLITSLNIDAELGSFAPDVVPFAFEKCREKFAKMFTVNTEGFYFKHAGGIGVASFLLKTEAVLKQPFSKFCETNRDSILWIEPSYFWKTCPMRRSLLTILIRCGNVYDVEEDNYEEALFGHEYVVPTKKAMMRFLFGFTRYVGPDISSHCSSTVQTRGWKLVFEGKNDAEVKEMLVRPDHSLRALELKSLCL